MATAAALTVDTTNRYFDPKLGSGKNKFYIITLDWTSTDGGAVSLDIIDTWNTAVTALGYHYPYVNQIKGKLYKIETSPGTEGAPATNPPTDGYDVTLLDAYSVDLTDGNLANLSNTAAAVLVFDTPVPVDSEVTLTIANAGDANNGRILLTLVE